MRSVLFLAPGDLGETVLATGALAHVLQREDKVTVVCGPDAAALFRAVPGLTAIHVIRPDAVLPSWLEFVLDGVRGRAFPWDVGIDGRGGLAGQLFGLRIRRIVKAQVVRHRTEEWAEAVGAERALAPKLWLDDAARAAAARIAPDSLPLLLLAPGGVSADKRWQADRFSAVARRLADGPLRGGRVVLLGAAARDADITRTIANSLDADGIRAGDLGAGLDLLAAAALSERATLVIGNDNALTHIAAAMGAPTLTLFGPTDERVRAPAGVRTRTIRGRSLQELAASPALDAGAAMGEITVDAVEAAALELLHAGGLR